MNSVLPLEWFSKSKRNHVGPRALNCIADCAFTGTLAGSGEEFSGTITATGCTDAIVNGAFEAKAEREDGNALEVELVRETETGGTRVKVKIEGRLSKQ